MVGWLVDWVLIDVYQSDIIISLYKIADLPVDTIHTWPASQRFNLSYDGPAANGSPCNEGIVVRVYALLAPAACVGDVLWEPIGLKQNRLILFKKKITLISFRRKIK